jgi:hypothetical protein
VRLRVGVGCTDDAHAQEAVALQSSSVLEVEVVLARRRPLSSGSHHLSAGDPKNQGLGNEVGQRLA